MFDDNALYKFKLHYLYTVKDFALDDIQQAQIQFGLPEFLLRMIADSSFQEIEQLAKQDLQFSLIPDERLFVRCLMEPDNEMLQLSLSLSSNLAAKPS